MSNWFGTEFGRGVSIVTPKRKTKENMKMSERAIKDFEDAVRIHEMRGSHHPSQYEFIDGQYVRAKQKLQKLIKKLREQARANKEHEDA